MGKMHRKHTSDLLAQLSITENQIKTESQKHIFEVKNDDQISNINELANMDEVNDSSKTDERKNITIDDLIKLTTQKTSMGGITPESLKMSQKMEEG